MTVMMLNIVQPVQGVSYTPSQAREGEKEGPSVIVVVVVVVVIIIIIRVRPTNAGFCHCRERVSQFIILIPLFCSIQQGMGSNMGHASIVPMFVLNLFSSCRYMLKTSSKIDQQFPSTSIQIQSGPSTTEFYTTRYVQNHRYVMHQPNSCASHLIRLIAEATKRIAIKLKSLLE